MTAPDPARLPDPAGQPDYARLIDAATWAFIRETEGWYPPDATGLTIAGQRAVYDRMARAFHRGRPAGVTTRDRPFGGVACRVYRPAAVVFTVLYLHGGGFVVGGLDSHDDICAEIAAATGARVVAVDYRLAPEHRHPAAFDDALAAARAVAVEFPGPLILAGDSAGGCLAAAVAQRARAGGPAVAGQVLIYPGLGGASDRGSYLSHAHAPMLSRDDVLWYARIRHGGGQARCDDPTADPLRDSDFAGLPPSVIISAECDPLADDGRDYRDRIRAAGGRADWICEAGLVHGYLRARASVPRAAASFGRITAAIAALGRGHWPAL